MSLESCGGRISSRLLSLRQLSRQAGTWQHVTASNPPAERVTRSSVVIDAQQRIWIFGGFRYRGRYQGRGPRVKALHAVG